MADQDSLLQHYYSARAREYDEIYLKPERQPDLRAIEKWLPTVFTGARVLEVACGTGYWTQFLAPVASHMVAIDASPETMHIAKGRIAADKVRFAVGDAYDLSADLGSFSAAFAGFWFSHIPKNRQHEFVQGLNQRLVTGAQVVFLDNLYVEGSSSPLAETDAEGNTYQLRRLKDGSVHRVLKNFPAEAELQQLPGVSGQGRFMTWQHYWAFAYVVGQP